MANFPDDIVSFVRLNKKARKGIGEETDLLKSRDENRVTPRDIWV